MTTSVRFYSSLRALSIGAILSILLIPAAASAQRRQAASSPRLLDAGTTISVRTTQPIDAKESDGRVFLAVVDQDVLDNRGNVSIPRGSDVELVVKNLGNDELAIDLEAVEVNERRYGVVADTSTVAAEDRDGLGTNSRTGKYVGGGALLGAIIGGIAGGGKGAVIGAGAGAAAGAGTQVLTRGRTVNIPVESLLTFRLQQPLRSPAPDTGFTRDGYHYHAAYNASADATPASESTPAYRAGLQAGRSDKDRRMAPMTRSDRWNTPAQRRDYEAGYNVGYNGDSKAAVAAPANPRQGSLPGNARATINIARDNNVSWQSSELVRVYVQVDNNPRQLFGEGQSGTQLAPWIARGHVYVFVVMDLNGNELARDRLDLR